MLKTVLPVFLVFLSLQHKYWMVVEKISVYIEDCVIFFRDFTPYGGGSADGGDRDRAYPFARPGDKSGFGAKDIAASMAGGVGYPGMGGSKSYSPYTTTNSSSYTGANYSSFGK
jgi:hypothetical protein